VIHVAVVPVTAAGNPLNALTYVFAYSAMVLIGLFGITGWLAWRNRRKREELSDRVTPETTESAGEKGHGPALRERARVLTIGDLVMDLRLRETYRGRAGRTPPPAAAVDDEHHHHPHAHPDS
jgi:hypothetical protein